MSALNWLGNFDVCLLWLGTMTRSGPAQQNMDLAKLQVEAVQRTREYLRINTTNPPGDEVESMRWLARIFKEEGIPFDTAVSAPGRGNIWARLKGGTQPALVLLGGDSMSRRCSLLHRRS